MMNLHFEQDAPYWHRAVPLEESEGGPLPGKADIVVVGAGFTGLSCALELARLGRDVLVLDAKAPGFGASTRNGGMIGWGHRQSLSSLSKRYGEDAAKAILAEGPASLSFTLGLIEREGIDCEFQRTGRFLGAASPRHFESVRRDAEQVFQPLGVDCRVVPLEDQGEETAAEVYCGGVVFEDHGALHPGKFHAGLLAAARKAGVRVEGHAAVIGLAHGEGGWTITTARGVVGAGEIVYAANAYGGGFSEAFKRFQRRLLPIPSFLIATETLGENRIRALMPGGRCYVDTRSSHSYYRSSPDGTRILWGGRASLNPLPEPTAKQRLIQHMTSVFPSMQDVRIEECWTGFVAFTRDVIPHLGRMDGVWFAGGYCGSGVAMAPYLGWLLAQKIAATDRAGSAFDATAMGSFPPYRGAPWFLRGIELWHRWKDRRDGVLAPIDWR